MAGNPFRRQVQPPALPEEESELPSKPSTPPTTGAASDRRSSKVKRVRIATPPPLSPDPTTPILEESPIYQVADESHTGSPPPEPSNPSEFDIGDPQDPFHRDSDEYEPNLAQDVIENTRRNSETDTNSSISNIPNSVKNPFQRTLATIEGSGDGNGDGQQDEQTSTTDAAEHPDSRPSKPAMDVDAFKRLLMTGNAAARPSGSPSSQGGGSSAFGSYFPWDNSSTDTSSVSRHSVFDNSVETAPDSPGSPYETSQVEQEVRAKSDTIGQDSKKKPPLPKHRHGKSVGQYRTPQTVSFDNFAPNEELTQTAKRSSMSISRPPLPKVPPPPTRTESSNSGSSLSTLQPANYESVASREGALSELPEPRSSSREQPRSRAESNLSDSSRQSSVPPRSPKLDSQTSNVPRSAPPPPPPTRRQPGVRKQQGSIDSSIADVSPMASETSSQVNGISTIDSKIAKQTIGSNSGSPRSSISTGRPSMPPPPPPPRRRESSRSSGEMPTLSSLSRDGSRTGRRSQDSGRQATDSLVEEAQPAREISPPSSSSHQPHKSDVLADLDALQAQVDALRGSSRGAG